MRAIIALCSKVPVDATILVVLSANRTLQDHRTLARRSGAIQMLDQSFQSHQVFRLLIRNLLKLWEERYV